MPRQRRVRRGGALLHRRRLVVVAGVAVAGYAALVARAVQLHTIDATWLRELADDQHYATIHLQPMRGALVDRTGELLAMSANVESVAAAPRDVPQLASAAALLARALGLERRQVARRLGSSSSFVWIKRWVTPREAERVRRLGLDGVTLHPERKRFYPNRDLAGPYLGFAGHDGVGLSGIELAYDPGLRGAAVSLRTARDGRGRGLPNVTAAAPDPAGGRLVLALDARLQHHAERALDRALLRTRARHATLLALDPQTGDVLALAERPAFDPNRFWEEEPARFRTRAFTDAFEPGSTLKPFVIALALEAGAVRPSDRFDCENGAWRVRDRTIRDYRPHGVLSVHDILRLSSNIGAAKVAERLGSAKLVEGLRRLGFGSRTGSGYPGEARGVVRSLRERQAVERANLAFGQGLAVTAAQLATAGAALVNGGWRVQPRLALRLERGEEILPLPPVRGERVISERAAESVLEMMRAAVASGTGRAAALPRHVVAGKTGTAQKVIGGSYSQDRTVASFLGVVPAHDPRLLMVVVLDEPQGLRTGGAVAAPVFREVAAFAVEQLALPETTGRGLSGGTGPGLSGRTGRGLSGGTG